MTTAELLLIVQQFVGEAAAVLGGEAETYTDSFILEYVKTMNFMLIMSDITTSISVDPLAETITPDPSDSIGMLLATKTAAGIIGGDLLKKVRLGELGISFKSGATSITTSEAAKKLNDIQNRLIVQADRLETMYLSDDPNSRFQRKQ